MKKVLICWAICAGFFLNPAKAVTTSAQSAILMDAESGRILYAQDIDTPRSIASITKLMTALVCVESFPDLDRTVLIDPLAVGIEGSSLYLKPMEEYSVRDLLYGLLLHSGNDAAVALAIACSGDETTFVEAMNYKARTLGMTHTHFQNPHGLEGEGHYSTARDMAVLAREVLKYPDLMEICGTKTHNFGSTTLVNHNKLLGSYGGAVGFKTGYTQAAGRTLVSGARRSEGVLIAVTLDDREDWADHAALLDYGFEHYRSYPLCRAGKSLYFLPVVGSALPYVTVVAQEDLSCMLKQEERVTARVQLPSSIQAPVETGDILGSLSFYAEGEEIGQTYLVAGSAAPASQKLTLAERLGRSSPIFNQMFQATPVWKGPLTRGGATKGD